MKVVALIPIWLQYHHDIDDHDSREVLKLGGRYLINYSLSSNEVTPHPSTIKPVIIEQASLYVFSKILFLETRRRTDKNPYIHFLDHFEGHEVRFREDMEIAKLIIDSGFQGGASR
jgi:CMP-N-acetylneuraminic acid synthetase